MPGGSSREVFGDDRWQQLPVGGPTLPHLFDSAQAFIGDLASQEIIHPCWSFVACSHRCQKAATAEATSG